MEIIKQVKDYKDGQRPMDGYRYDGEREIDKDAVVRAYPHLDKYELERKISGIVDYLLEGFEPIFETDIGLCTVAVHWETKEPLAWCKVREENGD